MGIILISLGMLVMLIGWIWLIITGFKVGGVLWGVLNIFFQPITGLIFAITQKAGWMQLGIMFLGWIIIIVGVVLGGGGTYEYSVP